ncbi:hypothetical protein I3842_14G035500 [Carya illinoinensis]|uniref:Uncharacterized protein n=1 Tax=Carya illinoinensis TaxID=32201 RepID=A0A922AEZ4_CARIL|nr:hypothetical protein I3842_14G035500 [Carya illinoinensis]
MGVLVPILGIEKSLILVRKQNWTSPRSCADKITHIPLVFLGWNAVLYFWWWWQTFHINYSLNPSIF